MKLSVSGTRQGWNEAQRQFFLDAISTNEITEFHYGDCIGVDEQSLWELLDSGQQPELFIYPAKVSEKYRANTIKQLIDHHYGGGIVQYQPRPPLVRNRDIVEGTDELWAFPGQSGGGTWNAIAHADDLRIKNWVITPDGLNGGLTVYT